MLIFGRASAVAAGGCVGPRRTNGGLGAQVARRPAVQGNETRSDIRAQVLGGQVRSKVTKRLVSESGKRWAIWRRPLVLPTRFGADPQ